MPRKSVTKNDVRVSTSEESETSVTKYLATLGTPRKRGRQPRPKPDFEAATKGITDPLEKLAAIKKERERVANVVVGDDAEQGFVKYAKAWANVHGYSREDFAALGVPRRVLESAFGTGPARSRATTARTPRVATGELAAAIAAKPPGTWLTLNGVMDEFGGSPATVRKVLDELAANGTVTDPIDDPKHSGRGRAPKVWERN